MARTNGTSHMNGHAKHKFKAKHDRSLSTAKLSRQFGKRKSLVRVVVALCLAGTLFAGIRHYIHHDRSFDDGKAVETVLGNCASIEALRHADECFETHEIKRGRTHKPERHILKASTHLEHEETIPWISPYGLVLDYDAAYDRMPSTSDEELYTTKRTLKCMTGFHMSVVWDIEFATPLLEAYQKGEFGIKPDTPNEIAASCPPADMPSSASMSIKINCGFDIQRDAWGHPATEHDLEELETCLRMSWSWVKGRAGDQQVEPWSNLCLEGEHGLFCRRDVFNLEGAD